MKQDDPGGRSKRKKKRKVRRKTATVIGWREMVSLPDLGLTDIRAKIDTGARTTALHATRIRTYSKDGADWVEFHPEHPGIDEAHMCCAPVHDVRDITNTSGVPEKRIIIRTHLSIAGLCYLVEISLADRADMAFPIIIGRTAIRGHRLLVDSGKSWLASRKKEAFNEKGSTT